MKKYTRIIYFFTVGAALLGLVPGSVADEIPTQGLDTLCLIRLANFQSDYTLLGDRERWVRWNDRRRILQPELASISREVNDFLNRLKRDRSSSSVLAEVERDDQTSEAESRLHLLADRVLAQIPPTQRAVFAVSREGEAQHQLDQARLAVLAETTRATVQDITDLRRKAQGIRVDYFSRMGEGHDDGAEMGQPYEDSYRSYLRRVAELSEGQAEREREVSRLTAPYVPTEHALEFSDCHSAIAPHCYRVQLSFLLEQEEVPERYIISNILGPSPEDLDSYLRRRMGMAGCRLAQTGQAGSPAPSVETSIHGVPQSGGTLTSAPTESSPAAATALPVVHHH